MTDSFPFDFTINNSKKAKNLRIALKPCKKVILTKPWFIPQYLAIQFLKKNENWVIKNLSKVKESLPKEKNTIYYLGNIYKLKFSKGKLNFQITDKILNITSIDKKVGLRALLTRLKKKLNTISKNQLKNIQSL